MEARVVSCGCYRNEQNRKRSLKHGCARQGQKTFEYMVWKGIKARCLNPKNPLYQHYGGRGIKVYERWARSFVDFIADVGPAPSRKHTIEREDNDGDYEPGNVRWATRKEQARNRRSTRYLEHGGVSKSVAEWAEQAGVPYKLFWARLKKHTLAELLATS